jgi:hypothetical protein
MDCGAWQRGMPKIFDEWSDRLRGAVDFDLDIGAAVSDMTHKFSRIGEPPDERAESDPLNDSANSDASMFHRSEDAP